VHSQIEMFPEPKQFRSYSAKAVEPTKIVEPEAPFPYWPHQIRIHEDCQAMWGKQCKVQWSINTCKRFCVVAPCGAGKTANMLRIIRNAVSKGLRVVIYSCRIQNTKQIIETLEKHGIVFGVVAAAFKGRTDIDAPVQVCQMQTVHAREFIPEADIVLVDEAHQQASAMAKAVFDWHIDSGCMSIIGYTATPVSVKDFYDHIIDPPTFQSLLDCNAHMPARIFVPDTPEAVLRSRCKALPTKKDGELTLTKDREYNPTEVIYGNVLEWLLKINPNLEPTVLFAPSVDDAYDYVRRFANSGIRAASIDANRVTVATPAEDGSLFLEEYDSTLAMREMVLNGLEDGTYKVVCNRFILRESFDCPALKHCIITTTMAGLSTYLQSVGRVLRYTDKYEFVTIQDHSGSCFLHGRPDRDRVWTLEDTNKNLAALERNGNNDDTDNDMERVCPSCSCSRQGGDRCPQCGHISKRQSYVARNEVDGKLIEIAANELKPKEPAMKNADHYLNDKFFGASKSGATVKQAFKLAKIKATNAGMSAFKPESIYLPHDGSKDWHRPVRDVYKYIGDKRWIKKKK
jgi:DNA repair protein RadD